MTNPLNLSLSGGNTGPSQAGGTINNNPNFAPVRVTEKNAWGTVAVVGIVALAGLAWLISSK